LNIVPGKPSPKEAERLKQEQRLGKMLLDFQDLGIKPGKGYYRTAFIKGIVSGLGGVIGATLVLAVFLWTLSLFNEVPLVGRFVRMIEHVITSEKSTPAP
jgi:hypothetical protein